MLEAFLCLLILGISIALLIITDRLNKINKAFSPTWEFVKNLMEVQKNAGNSSGNTDS